MSDDNDGILTGHPNSGLTLPDNKNATHNINLSPLFIERSGRGSSSYTEYATMWRGGNGYLLTMSLPQFAQFDQTGTIWPSTRWTNYVTQSLRCLVSTNNRIRIKDESDELHLILPAHYNLVSDDPGTNHWNTNAGWTLPSDSKATHDIGLSPLFPARNGYGGNIEQEHNAAILEQGSQGYRWTNISRKDSLGYYQGSNDTQSLPIEYGNRAYPFSLRCLVSTNNRIIINDLRRFSESKTQKRLIKANSVFSRFFAISEFINSEKTASL